MANPGMQVINGIAAIPGTIKWAVMGFGNGVANLGYWIRDHFRSSYHHVAIIPFENDADVPNRQAMQTKNPIGYWTFAAIPYAISILLAYGIVPTVLYFSQGILYNARAGLNLILADRDQIKLGGDYKKLFQSDTKAYTLYTILSGGWLFGLATGFVLAGGAIAYRFVDDFPKMFGRSFRSLSNIGWYDKYQHKPGDPISNELLFDHGDDNLPNGAHHVYGVFGTITGSIVGFIVGVSVLTWHGLEHSGAMTKRTFYSLLNKLAFHKDDQFTKDKNYELFLHEDPAEYKYQWRMGLGWPGIVAGGIFAAIALPFIWTGRVGTNSWTMIGRFYRSTVNNVKYKSYNYNSADPKAVDSYELLTENGDDADHGNRKWIGGFFGALIGGGAGLIASVFILSWHGLEHSGAMTKRTFYSLLNKLALHKDDQFTKDKEYELFLHADLAEYKYQWRMGLGSPGIVAGAIFAVVALPFIWTGRVATNSWTMIGRFYRSSVNNVKYKPYNYNSADPTAVDSYELLTENGDDAEHGNRKWIGGFFGALIGGGAGLIASVFILSWHGLEHSGAMTKRTFYSLLNKLALHKDDQFTKDKEYELFLHADPAEYKYQWRMGLGSPGIVVGAIFATILLPLIWTGRFGTNSWTMIGRFYRSTVNNVKYKPYNYNSADPTAVDSYELLTENGDDADHGNRKWIGGFFGALIGGGAGLIASVFILSWHGLEHSGAMTKRTFYSLLNKLALHKDDQFTKDKEYELFLHADPAEYKYQWRMGLGSPGIVAGAIFAVVALPFIWTGRVATNSWTMIGRFYRSSVNNVKYKPYNYNSADPTAVDSYELLTENGDDADHGNRKWIGGFFGALIGGGAGLIASVFILSWHGLEHSGAMTKRTFYSLLNKLALHKDDQFTKDKEYELFLHADPAEYKYQWRMGLGSPGIVAGAIFAVVALPFIWTGRVATNSWTMIGRFYRSSVNNVKYKPYNYNSADPKAVDSYELLTENGDDAEHGNRKWIGGFFGALIGGGFGLIASICIVSWHRLEDTAVVTARTYRYVTNWARHTEDQYKNILNEPSNPTAVEFPDYVDAGQLEGRYWKGGLGYIIGGFAGVIAAAGIATYRIIGNTALAYWEMLKVYYNVVIEFDVYDKIPEDVAQENLKKSGIPGYMGTYLGQFLSLFPFGIAVGVVWGLKNYWHTPFALVSILLTPVVFITKLASKFVKNYLREDIRLKPKGGTAAMKPNIFTHISKPTRFPKKDAMHEPLIEDDVERDFKTLNSALNMWGELEPGTISHTPGSGGEKSWASFVRKSAFLNTKSPTELVLDGLLYSFREFRDANSSGDTSVATFAQSSYYDSTMAGIINEYKSMNGKGAMFETRAGVLEEQEKSNEINEIAKRVIAFLSSASVQLTVEADFYAQYQTPSLFSHIWKPAAPQQQQQQQQQQPQQQPQPQYQAVIQQQQQQQQQQQPQQPQPGNVMPVFN